MCARAITTRVVLCNGYTCSECKYKALIEGLVAVMPKVDRAVSVEAIWRIEPCAVTGEITDEQVALALGEHADMWPEALRDYSESAEIVKFGR